MTPTPTAPPDSTQLAWDAEDAARACRKRRDLAAAVRAARQKEERARERLRTAKKTRQRAEQADAFAAQGGEPFDRQLAACREAALAYQTERETRQALGLARLARQRAQDEFRAERGRLLERYPLLEHAAAQQAQAAETPAGEIERSVIEPDLETLLEAESIADEAAAGEAPGPTPKFERSVEELGLPSKWLDRLRESGWTTVGSLVDLAARAVAPLEHFLRVRGWAPVAADAVQAALVRWLRANPLDAAEGAIPSCTACGCTEFDCAHCIVLTGEACLWATEDPYLCTACANAEPSADGRRDCGCPADDAGDCAGLNEPGLRGDQMSPEFVAAGEAAREAQRPKRKARKARPEPAPEPAPESPPVEDLDDAEPMPAGITITAVADASVVRKLATETPRGKPGKPVSVKPLDFDGRLWVAHRIAYRGEAVAECSLLPLVPVAEFEERYVAYPTRYRPEPSGPQADAAADREARLQYYTGVVVKVGRREYAIAPAGEGRTFRAVNAKEEQ